MNLEKISTNKIIHIIFDEMVRGNHANYIRFANDMYGRYGVDYIEKVGRIFVETLGDREELYIILKDLLFEGQTDEQYKKLLVKRTIARFYQVLS